MAEQKIPDFAEMKQDLTGTCTNSQRQYRVRHENEPIFSREMQKVMAYMKKQDVEQSL
jgi:hypothetical protein